MGIHGFSDCCYKSIQLEWEHLLHVLHYLKRKRLSLSDESVVANSIGSNDTQPSKMGSPIIDIDANNIGFNFLKSSPALSLLDMTQYFTDNGISVKMVADNKDIRHCSKRASFKRASEREIAWLDFEQLHMELNHKLQNGEDGALIAKELERCERKMNKTLPSDNT